MCAVVRVVFCACGGACTGRARDVLVECGGEEAGVEGQTAPVAAHAAHHLPQLPRRPGRAAAVAAAVLGESRRQLASAQHAQGHLLWQSAQYVESFIFFLIFAIATSSRCIRRLLLVSCTTINSGREEELHIRPATPAAALHPDRYLIYCRLN
jgi:hypothetical protein